VERFRAVRAIRAKVSLAALLSLSACDFFAVQTAPKKEHKPSKGREAERADALFWKTLHEGAYEDIPLVLRALKSVYLQNQSDGVTAAHIGFMHLWRLSERARLSEIPPEITDDAVLARKYFDEAVKLVDDARFRGFHAAATMAEGTIHDDQASIRRGYYLGRDAIDAWPEFNLFTMGYVLSLRPHDDERFGEALDWQWRAVDLCCREKVDRDRPDIAGCVRQNRDETDPLKQRACWNGEIAPHNTEGFLLNMGDMLVKAGRLEAARRVYEGAKAVEVYDSWPYRSALEARLVSAEENVEAFRARTEPTMLESTFACAGCHQR
jgi:hypothetical protein